jgi:hypothetical protein
LHAAEEKLASATAELERRTALNERLETDLLQMQQRPAKTKTNGDDTRLSADRDILDDLDLGSADTHGVRAFPFCPCLY